MSAIFIRQAALALLALVITIQGVLAQVPDPETFNKTFSHRRAHVDGVQLHYVIGGKGDAVVLLHGWLGTWYTWRKVMPLLSEHYTVIVPDVRGYGDSDKPDAGYDARTIGREIRGLVRQLGFERVFVVGHDMGALPALAYAAEFPGEVRGLVYMDEPLPGYNLQEFLTPTRRTAAGTGTSLSRACATCRSG
jgi:pimeloyl-ACP methyl ester carboxylesterase